MVWVIDLFGFQHDEGSTSIRSSPAAGQQGLLPSHLGAYDGRKFFHRRTCICLHHRQRRFHARPGRAIRGGFRQFELLAQACRFPAQANQFKLPGAQALHFFILFAKQINTFIVHASPLGSLLPQIRVFCAQTCQSHPISNGEVNRGGQEHHTASEHRFSHGQLCAGCAEELKAETCGVFPFVADETPKTRRRIDLNRGAKHTQAMKKWMVADAEHLGGSPRVRDTHISVALILESLAAGLSVADIVDAYPSLTEEAVRSALAELAPPRICNRRENPAGREPQIRRDLRVISFLSGAVRIRQIGRAHV